MPKDDLGLYYYPLPQEKSVRVYVREGQGGVEFRLWNSRHPEIWDKHEWVPIDALRMASRMYRDKRGSKNNPMDLYDLDIALRLIQDDKKSS